VVIPSMKATCPHFAILQGKVLTFPMSHLKYTDNLSDEELVQ